MGGNIDFESNSGNGTTFSFSFETGYEFGNKQTGKGIESVHSVLVIDDNLNNRTILEHTLLHWGINFTGVESGYTGLELLNQNNKFDLIIVDYHMPEMNGMDTIKLIREKLDATNFDQPIMMLHSSSDDISLYELAKLHRVRFMLTKPIKQDELYHYLCNLYQVESAEVQLNDSEMLIEKNTISNAGDASNNYKILVAEDTEMNMLVISNMLRNIIPDVVMFEAVNGVQAVAIFKAEKPDLVLMDVQMPELDGVGATKQIKKLKESNQVPIIALTAGVSKEEREACFDAGMEDFLAKPIEVEELKRIINTYLLVKKAISGTSKKSKNLKIKIHFDKEKLLSKIGNEDTMNTILKMSLVEYPKYLAELGDAIDRFDVDMIKRFAHKLKGSALNMEFVHLSELAQFIENKSDNIKEVQQLYVSLKQEWQDISKLLV
jgi:CheY-like chemotaxis protein